jgi:uncharacterized protein YlxW (UPF0749 family)
MIGKAPGFTALLVILATSSVALAQTSQPSDSIYVSRQEYEQLKAEHDQMRQQIQTLMKDKETTQADTDDYQKEMDDKIKVIQDAIDRDKAGLQNITIVGDMSTGFTTQRKNA